MADISQCRLPVPEVINKYLSSNGVVENDLLNFRRCRNTFVANNSSMTANYMLKDTAGSSPGNRNLHLASNIKSYQQFQDNNKSGNSLPMEYEDLLNSHIDQDSSNPKACCSEKGRNEGEYGEIVCDNQIFSTGCDKDVDFDMLVKDCSNSGIDKDEECCFEVKLQQESGIPYADYETTQSTKDILESEDIEPDANFGIVIKHREECERIETNSSNESSRGNSRMINVDCDKMDNNICDKNSHDSDMFQHNSSSVICVENDDNFDITSADSDEEFPIEIRYKSPLVGSKGKSKASKQKPQIKNSARKDAENGRLKATISPNFSENQIHDFNSQESEHFVHLEKNSGHISNEEFCFEVSQVSSDVRSRQANEHEFDQILSKNFSAQSPQIWSNDCLSNLRVDSTNDLHLDLLSPSVEINLKKGTSSGGEYQAHSGSLQSQGYDPSCYQLDDYDSVDGLFPVSPDGSSSFFQVAKDEAISSSLMTNMCGNDASASNSLALPSCKTLDDNTMLISSDLLDSNSNELTASFAETDTREYTVTLGCTHISSECARETESIDRSKHGQKQRSNSDTETIPLNCGLPLSRADTLSLVDTSPLLPTDESSSNSDIQHITDPPTEELDINYITLSESGESKNVQITTTLPHKESLTTTALPLMESSDSSVNSAEMDGSTETAVPTQNLQLPIHDEGAQYISPNTNTVTDNTNSIPSTSAYSPENGGIVVAGAQKIANEHFPISTNFSNAKLVSMPSLYQVGSPRPAVDGAKPVTDNRHIKSILSSYMSHRLKSQNYSNEDINNVADEFALVFNSSRKRSSGGNYTETAPDVKKPCFGVSADEGSSNDSKMAMEVGSSPYGRPSSQTRKSVLNVDSLIRLCKICDTSGPGSKFIKCRNAHVICKSCLEDEIRLVMASEKMCLACPEESCKTAIPIDCLSSALPSFIVDLLSDNLRMKEQKASAKAIKKMQGLVICPRCACPGLLEEQELHFVCATCKSGSCRYCKRPWLRVDQHDCCYLLMFVGLECLQNISKPPRNWNMGVTPFNKNFVQVNVPLNSAEGAAVAAFCAKTSLGRSHVVQIFRIQNVKLWEKYILKRKHVEDDIGTADLKENFLFHGTKAENIVNICGEGFDIRVPTSNGALLGKGIYFSISARYSEKFADKSGMLFLSRVICGWSQTGQRQLTRPHYHSTSRRMYDSCVDNVSSPTMYTVFDNSQCYPEYLIRFAQ